MTTSLCDFLHSIPEETIVSSLNALLDRNPRVWISPCGGQRMVSIDRCEGSVEINQIAGKYLLAPEFSAYSGASLQNRLKCYDLWNKILTLYKKSDEELKKVWFFTRHLTYFIDALPHSYSFGGDPQAAIRNPKGKFFPRDSVFTFSEETFRQIWPNQEPTSKCEDRNSQGAIVTLCCASKEMVDEYMRRLK